MKRSISFRLTCWFSAIFLAGFAGFGIAMWLDLALQLSQGRDRTLGRRAARCFELLVATQDRSQSRRDQKFEEFTDATPEGNLILVYDEQGTLILADPDTPPGFPWPSLPTEGSDHFENKRFDSRVYRVLTRNANVGSRRLAIQVAGQLEDNRQLLGRFQAGLEGAIPVLLVVSAVCGYFVSRRALKPVDRLISGVRAINAHDLSARLPVHSTGDELQRLAETCNDMLARVENAVSRTTRFTADASHELRSPISFVRTVSEFALQRHTLDAETRQAFEDILAESIEAGDLLEDMLALARADEGSLVLNLAPLDLSEVLEEVCDKARLLAFAKDQIFITDISLAQPVWVEGDRPTLRRLFFALLDNAVKYTPEGGHIGVELGNRGSNILVSISDSGIGIPEDMRPRIFERFFRADVSRGKASGTGLGLAIAKWIADAHRATISVNSRQGEGAVFEIVFQPLRHA